MDCPAQDPDSTKVREEEGEEERWMTSGAAGGGGGRFVGLFVYDEEEEGGGVGMLWQAGKGIQEHSLLWLGVLDLDY